VTTYDVIHVRDSQLLLLLLLLLFTKCTVIETISVIVNLSVLLIHLFVSCIYNIPRDEKLISHRDNNVTQTK
jgi:hypothetical protein